jgi:hypothetical protein
MLANEVNDTPTTVALLDMRERERRHFGPPQTAAEKDGKNRAVAQASNGSDVGRA